MAVYLSMMAATVYAVGAINNRNHTAGVSYYDLEAFKELNNSAQRCNEELGTNFNLRSTSFGDWELYTAATTRMRSSAISQIVLILKAYSR